MRIVAGKHKGRRLTAPVGLDIRPTSDRAREALFNILAHGDYHGPGGSMPVDCAVLDAFAGTGAMGLEALSRGATSICFIERNETAARLIKNTAEAMGEAARVSVRCADATRPGPAPTDFDLAFLDAPYRSGQSEPSLHALADMGWLRLGCIACVELAKGEHFQAGEPFRVLDERTYGAARIVILRWSGTEPNPG